MDTRDVEAFVSQYSSPDAARVAFVWNGKHAEEFKDDSQVFRWQVIEYCLTHPDAAPAELLAALFEAETRWTREARGASKYLTRTAELFLKRVRASRLDVFIRGVLRSKDTYGACSQMELPEELAMELAGNLRVHIRTVTTWEERVWARYALEIVVGIRRRLAAKRGAALKLTGYILLPISLIAKLWVSMANAGAYSPGLNIASWLLYLPPFIALALCAYGWRLQRFAKASAFRRLLMRWNFRALAYRVFAVIIIVAAIPAVVALQLWLTVHFGASQLVHNTDDIKLVTDLIVALPIMALGWIAWQYGKLRMVPDAMDLLDEDNRRPIVYLRLRSGNDETAGDEGRPWMSRLLGLVAMLLGPEEILAKVVNEFGPFISVRRDRSGPPTRWTASALADGGVGKAFVEELVKNAAVVVVRAENTPEFFSELKSLSKSVSQKRILILLPFRGNAFRRFLQGAEITLSKPLPKDTFAEAGWLDAIGMGGLPILGGMIYIEDDDRLNIRSFDLPFRFKLGGSFQTAAKLRTHFKEYFRYLERSQDVPREAKPSNFSPDGITFDTSGLNEKPQSQAWEKEWNTNDGLLVTKSLYSRVEFPYDFTTPDLMKEYFVSGIQKVGACVIEFEFIEVAGVQGIWLLEKAWLNSDSNDLHMIFQGRMIFPLDEGCYILLVAAAESGMTGVRESTVTMMQIAQGKVVLPKNKPPIEVKSGGSLAETLKKHPLVVAPSDAREYDDTFPDHPLTRVRAKLRDIRGSLTIDAEVQAASPYRVRRTPPH